MFNLNFNGRVESLVLILALDRIRLAWDGQGSILQLC